MKNKKAIIIVNSVTMTRVIGTFILPFISIKICPAELVIYVGLLLLTDAIDGLLARRLKASTVFGSILDATADKLLGIACLAVLSQRYPIMLLPILTETIITIINLRGAIGGATTESSFLGKIKTWVLGLGIVLGFATIYVNGIISGINSSTIIGKYLIAFFENLATNQDIVMAIIASITVGAGIIVACDYQHKVKIEMKNAADEGFVLKKMVLKSKKDLLYALFDEEYYQKTKGIPLAKKIGEFKNEKNN
ncbi:MAG: CDP-alcohol phosphatidyltransferase family protein [Bacilli bacterium]|nr:CDP-alcohol phosphatidyltransferase family protein [Bacilli bacterium]